MDWKEFPYQFDGFENHLERIHRKKAEVEALRPLPYIALKSIRDSMTLEWIYNSNSIEGNTLTLQETKMVIEEGFTIKGKSLREHFEAINHQDAIDFVTSLVSDNYLLTDVYILTIHGQILQ